MEEKIALVTGASRVTMANPIIGRKSRGLWL